MVTDGGTAGEQNARAGFSAVSTRHTLEVACSVAGLDARGAQARKEPGCSRFGSLRLGNIGIRPRQGFYQDHHLLLSRAGELLLSRAGEPMSFCHNDGGVTDAYSLLGHLVCTGSGGPDWR